jgi:N-acyl-L-homoserine lactone synthetase
MTRIHVITKQNRVHYLALLQDYYRKRHDIFVEERGWSGLRRPDRRDVDSYDDDNAIYLLAVDGEKLVGGQRLFPTTRPHMMTEVFAHLVERSVPQDDRIFEWTRYFVVRERRTGRTDCRLLAGIQQYCLEEGISHLTAVVELWWLPRWHQAGFEVVPLGLPQMIEGQPTIAARIKVAPESYDSALRLGGLKPTELVRHGLMDDIEIEEMPHAA